ncbi:acyltransferase family protein [Planctomycetaceae bacterium SH139]
MVLLLVIAEFLPLPRSFGLTAPWVPSFFFCSLFLAGFCLLVSGDTPKLVVNGVVARIGVVSFSAYLWHWLVLDLFNKFLIGQWLFAQTRFCAIGAFIIAYVGVVILTWAIASLSYRLVEQTGVAFSRRLIQKRRSNVVVETELALDTTPSPKLTTCWNASNAAA